jgi:hypothetical protein
LSEACCAVCGRPYDRHELRELHVPIPRSPGSPPGTPVATAYLLLCPDDTERLAIESTKAALIRGLQPDGPESQEAGG